MTILLPPSYRNSLRRCLALTRKECWQILRDPSALAIGVALPLLLLILFGYGLSFNINQLPVALVVEHASDEASSATAEIRLSPSFAARQAQTMAEADTLMRNGEVQAILRLPPHFARDTAAGDAQIQVIVNATDANTARISMSYAEGALAMWRAQNQATQGAEIVVENRMWFNEANESTWFLVPGLIVLVMTLIGALLTSLVIAREWERGTFEALFATPVRPAEILISKTIPYFVMGMIGLALSVIGAKVLFGVPLRGSLWLLVLVSALYLMVALAIGLVISSATRNQFLANQITFLVTFLPATLLSGFIFDIRSMPIGPQILTKILPARYFVSSLQTLFLAGDVWAVILPDCLVLAGMAVFLIALAVRMTRKRLA